MSGDFAQNPTHDFTRTRFGQPLCKLDDIRGGNRTDYLAHQFDNFGLQFITRLCVGVEGDIGINPLPLDVVGKADNRGFGDMRVLVDRAFNLGGAKAVAGYVQNVVHTPCNPVITVIIPAAAIACKIFAFKGAEIRLDETVVVLINRAHLSRPAVGDAKRPFARAV